MQPPGIGLPIGRGGDQPLMRGGDIWGRSLQMMMCEAPTLPTVSVQNSKYMEAPIIRRVTILTSYHPSLPDTDGEGSSAL